jgi:GxxExxY protein
MEVHGVSQRLTKKAISDISFRIIGCAMEVHSELGPGLLESVYQSCLIEEAASRGLHVESEIAVPIHYKGKLLAYPLKLDLLIERCIIVELKAVEVLLPVFKAQLLSYLKLSNVPKGLLINFHTASLREGIVSLVTEQFNTLPES